MTPTDRIAQVFDTYPDLHPFEITRPEHAAARNSWLVYTRRGFVAVTWDIGREDFSTLYERARNAARTAQAQSIADSPPT